MKIVPWKRIGGQLLLLLLALVQAGSSQRNEDCTAVAKDEETLLVFSTLGGGLTAIDPMSGETRWSIADEPAIRVPSLSEMNPHYLPDPRDGSLYTYRNPEGGLKKLPYTIPQLVASAPCRSSDGILYSGKKSDDWFLIDPKTGRREKVLGFGAQPPPLEPGKPDSIGWATSRAVYLGRTQYTVMMYDSTATGRNSKPWNVTFFDYTSHTMAPELTKEYEFLHLTSSSSGLTATFEQKKGTPLWQKDLSSPVVAVFLLGSEGLLSVPFQTVSDEVLQEINDRARGGHFDNLKLFPTVYVGENANNIYAIPSLVDKSTATLPSEPTVNLLGGPNRHRGASPDDPPGHELIPTEPARLQNDNIIILGHYQPPKTDENLKLDIAPGSPGRFYKDGQLSTVLEFSGLPKMVGEQHTKTIGIQTEEEEEQIRPNVTTALKGDATLRTLFGRLYRDVKMWLDAQPNKLPTLMFVALCGVVVFGFWYFHMQMKALQDISQNGSQNGNSNRSSGSSCVEAVDFGAAGSETTVSSVPPLCSSALGWLLSEKSYILFFISRTRILLCPRVFIVAGDQSSADLLPHSDDFQGSTAEQHETKHFLKPTSARFSSRLHITCSADMPSTPFITIEHNPVTIFHYLYYQRNNHALSHL